MADNKKLRVTVGSHDQSHPHEGKAYDEGDVRSIRRSVLFIGATIVAYTLYLVLSGQIGSVAVALSQVSRKWILAAIACWGAYYALGVLAYAIGAAMDPKCPLGIRDLMSVEATGIFFSFLTPSGTGGAPAQILRLSKAGLSAGEAGAFQYTRFVVYEAGEGIFAAIMLLFRGQWFIETYGNVALVGAILFGTKIAEVALLLSACLMPKQVLRASDRIRDVADRHGWLPGRVNKWHETLGREIFAFSEGFRSAMSDIRETAAVTAVTLVQLGCQYALPWFTLRAFGREADLVTCLACGSMLELLTSAVPLPGGTGGAEGGFAYLFGHMFGSTLSAGYVIWRFVEYFLPILVALSLMALRSSHRTNIHQRFERMRKDWKRFTDALDRLIRKWILDRM